MISPDKDTVDKIASVLFGNIDLAVEDFLREFRDLPVIAQETANILFLSFVSGMVNVMNKNSSYNTKFKFTPPKGLRI